MAQEHLLILGGEQWLAFARSRIKALRASGLEYGSQKFEVEGSLIKVRVTPGHDYIEISGGSGRMYMDSGVIDLKVVFPRNPLRYKPGVFRDTTKTKAYKEPFTTTAGDWKTNKDGALSAQLAGDVSDNGAKLKGRVPVAPQPPASFAPLKTVADNGTVSYADEDGNLATKKLSAAVYPASCFTGRMRQYVQAMQGQPLYDPDSKDGSDVTGTAFSWTGVVPGVVIPYFNEPYLDTLPRRNVDANCSSGVIAVKNGKHWLVNVGSDKLYFFPLRASPTAEKARRLLKEDSDKLSIPAKEKLESYILATSRPVASRMVVVDLGRAYTSISMGYGWHWNWSGTKANIVTHIEYEQGVSVSGHPGIGLKSQHFQMNVAPQYSNSEVTGWTVSVDDMEGVKTWGVDRQVWCVAFPAWSSQYLDGTPLQEKLFPRWSKLLETTVDAPLYVFYNKDDLVLCRAKIGYVSGRTEYSGSSPLNTYGPGTAWALTEGNRGGFRKYAGAGPFYEAEFTVGSTTYKARPYGYAANGLQEVTSGVSRTSPPPNDWAVFVFNAGYYDFTVGYPSAYTNERRTPAPGVNSMSTSGSGSPRYKVNMTFTTSNVYVSYDGKTDILIPFYDAEAIYVSNKVVKQTYLTGQVRGQYTSTSHGDWSAYWSPIPPPGSYAGNEDFLRYYWASSSGDTFVSSVPIPNEESFATEDDTQVLISRGRAIPVFIGGDVLAQCQTPAEPASTVIFPAQSGIAVDDPVILSMFLPDGDVGVAEPDDLDTPAIVGWA